MAGGENCDTCCLDKGNCTYPENYQIFPVLAVIYQRTGGRMVLLAMNMSGSIHCFGYGLKGTGDKAGYMGLLGLTIHQFTHNNIPQPQFSPIQKPRSENPQFRLSLHRVLFVSPRPKAVYPVQLIFMMDVVWVLEEWKDCLLAERRVLDRVIGTVYWVPGKS